MPFKSEEQRRYLWANEPEIARDWTDTYGSRIQKNNGGIMRVPFANGEWVNYYADEPNEDVNTDFPNNTYSYSQIPSNFLNYQFENARTPFTGIQEGIGSIRNTLGQGLDKVGQGWDFAQQLPGMAMGALSGIPGLGFLINSMSSSPEQKAMMDLYESEDYQDLLGQIPGMENYNPTYITGSGYGLTGAIDKRIARIQKTLQNKTSPVLEQRLKNLQRLKNKEKDFFSDLTNTGANPTYKLTPTEKSYFSGPAPVAPAPVAPQTGVGSAGNIAPPDRTGGNVNSGGAAGNMGGGSRQATSAGSTKSDRTDGGWGWAEGGIAGLWRR
jgi:hypothetical protein